MPKPSHREKLLDEGLRGVLSQGYAGASAHSELIRRRLAEMFKDINGAIVYCLKAAVDAGELPASTGVRELASFLYSSWHGAILQSKVEQSARPLELFKRVLFGQVLR